eukprot:SAG31_NODE_2624_length_5360_cov_2.184946_3_plen_312_part_00
MFASAAGTDPDVMFNGMRCDGDIDLTDDFQLLSIGQPGLHDVSVEGLTGTAQFEAHAELNAGYNLEVDFEWDSSSPLGLPTAVNEVRAQVTGSFSAGVGFNIDVSAASTGDVDIQGTHASRRRRTVWNGHLGHVTLHIGVIAVTLNFDGRMKGKMRIDSAAHIQAHGFYHISKPTAAMGFHYQTSRRRTLSQILPNTHITRSIEPISINTDALLSSPMSAEVQVTLIPEVTMTFTQVIPVTVSLMPTLNARAQIECNAQSASAGVEVGLSGKITADRLNLDALGTHSSLKIMPASLPTSACGVVFEMYGCG